MKEIFKDLLEMDEVNGVVFVDLDGNTQFQEFTGLAAVQLTPDRILGLLDLMKNTREAEVIYDNARMLLRGCTDGILIVLASRFAVMSMIRLNCDILVSALASADAKQKKKGLGRLFRR